jgi:hypothetical protein
VRKRRRRDPKPKIIKREGQLTHLVRPLVYAKVDSLERLKNGPDFDELTSSNQKLTRMELQKLKSRKVTPTN